MEIFNGAIQYLIGPAVVAILALWGNRQLNKAKAKSEEASSTASLLDSQRKDFEVLLGPLRTQVEKLTARVRVLESQQNDLIGFSRVQQSIIRTHAPEFEPAVPPSLIDLI